MVNGEIYADSSNMTKLYTFRLKAIKNLRSMYYIMEDNDGRA